MKELLEKISPMRNVVVTGDTISGKTTNVLFPLFDKIIEKNENVIVYDTKIEYLSNYYDKLINKGYQINIINLRNLNNSDGWNPLELPYYYFKNDMKDIAEEMLDYLGRILCSEKKEMNSFLNRSSSSDLFTAISLALFEDGDENVINLNSIYEFITVGEEHASATRKYIDEYFKTKDPMSAIWLNAASTIVAPAETRESIISTVKNSLAKLIANFQISNLLNKSTFNFNDLAKKKMAIFVIGNPDSKNGNLISEMFFNQIMQYLEVTMSTIKCHIMLDNIDDIENLLRFDTYLRDDVYYHGRYYIGTHSVEKLERKYNIKAREISDIIKIREDEIELENSFFIPTKIKNDLKKVTINKSNIQYPITKINEIKTFDLKGYVDDKRKEKMENLINSVKPGLVDKMKANTKPGETDILSGKIDIKIPKFENKNTSKKIDIRKLENVIDETVRKIENGESDDINKEKIIEDMSKETNNQTPDKQSSEYADNEVNDLIDFITDGDSNKTVFLKNVLKSIYNDSIYYAVDDCLRAYSEELINKIDNNKREKQVISEMLEDFELSDITSKKIIDQKQKELLYMLNNAKLSHNKIYDDFFNEIQNNNDYLTLFIKYYLILSDYELRNNVAY